MENQNRLVVITGVSIIALVIGLMVVSNIVNGSTNIPTTGDVVFNDIDLSVQPRLGDENAPIILIAFEDFLCSHCKTFNEQVLPRLEREFIDKGDAQLHFISYAFLGERSIIAARASECVYKQDTSLFWDYKTVLMRLQGQSIYTPEGLVKVATDYVPQVDAVALQQCLESEETAARVQADSDIARSHQIQSTPSIVVQGVKVENASYDVVRDAIVAALDSSPATESN